MYNIIMINYHLRRIAFDGMLAALFFVLSLFSVDLGNMKITLDGLAPLVAGFLFSPLDGFIVGCAGSFLNQMLKYGFTATTLPWIIPAGLRGLIAGIYGIKTKSDLRTIAAASVSSLAVSTAVMLLFWVLSKLEITSGGELLSTVLLPAAALTVLNVIIWGALYALRVEGVKRIILAVIVSSIAVTTANSLVWWLDSVIYHYYSFASVFGTTLLRYATGIATAVVMAIVLPPILKGCGKITQKLSIR